MGFLPMFSIYMRFACMYMCILVYGAATAKRYSTSKKKQKKINMEILLKNFRIVKPILPL